MARMALQAGKIECLNNINYTIPGIKLYMFTVLRSKGSLRYHHQLCNSYYIINTHLYVGSSHNYHQIALNKIIVQSLQTRRCIKITEPPNPSHYLDSLN